ncbi:MAG: aromatase/cyclase [Actinomycetota bacterium]|nr:aromatase/cyclase [Actinomycetota bacterium]
MPLVEETIEISGAPEKLFPIISDFERYPDIMENVTAVNILEKGEGYTISEWITNVDGRVIRWVEKDYIKPLENRVDFELVKGDLKTFNGYWQLEESGDTTKVIFSIQFELGIPMFSAMVHPILARKLRENMKQMLSDMKHKIENQ